MTEPVFDLEATILDLIVIVAALKPPPTGAYPEAAAAMERLRELAKTLGLPTTPWQLKAKAFSDGIESN